MPIQVKTMRDVWDRKKKEKKEKEIKQRKIFPPEGEKSKLSSSPTESRLRDEGKEENEVFFAFAVAREIERHYLDYLARKKAFLETKDEIVKAFADYEKNLGEAGFSKIL